MCLELRQRLTIRWRENAPLRVFTMDRIDAGEFAQAGRLIEYDQAVTARERRYIDPSIRVDLGFDGCKPNDPFRLDRDPLWTKS